MAKPSEGTQLLLALDSSEGSLLALGWTLKNVVKPTDVVYVLHVRTGTAVARPSGGGLMPNETAAEVEQVHQRLAATVKLAGVDAQHVHWMVRDGLEAGPVIVKVANDLQVASIIVSSRGLGPVTGLLLGSVSKHVMSHADVPVVIVNPPPTASSMATTFKNLSMPGLDALAGAVTYKPA